MKNFTKLFVLASALFALACTTDATEDLELGLVGQTKVSLSLEEATKTHLGEKADNLYPLYWSEGDQISVNGVASTALTAAQAGKSSATFEVDGVHTVLNVAYPAAAANQVLFAGNQAHKSNTTFGNNATTLYGVGSADEGVVLNHLTGVLKIGVTGSATLTHAQISTIDRAPIAGAFDIDFTNGEVAATKDAVPTINYSFGDGVALSSTPTYMHIAVPAGLYDELYVTLYDNADGVMYATVKADETKPLTAGNVRQFSNTIAYKPSANLYIVKDVASLKALPSATTDAVLICDIDLSNESWTPLEGYAHKLNGNGYAIKGLKAPLFKSTSASIKGLHLVDVNITSSLLPDFGALVCTYGGPSISHCSVSGKMTLSEATNIGGLIGNVSNTDAYTISDCTNNCAINLTLASTATNLNLGGVVGLTADATDNTIETHLDNLKNTAKISVLSVADAELKNQLIIAGVVGNIGSSDTYMDGCYNTADVEVNLATMKANLLVGGCVSTLYRVADSGLIVRAKNFDNSGSVTTTVASSTQPINVGGCFARLCHDKAKSIEIENMTNSGAISLVSPGSCTSKTFVGGIVGWAVNPITAKKLLNDTTGSVTLTLNSKSGTDNPAALGGLFGYLRCPLKADLTVSDSDNKAKIETRLATNAARLCCGGCFGMLFPFTTKEYLITVDDVDNYGSVVFNNTLASSNDNHIGGIIGGILGDDDKGVKSTATTNYFKILNCDNVGDKAGLNKINVTNGTYATTHIGGLVGLSWSHLDSDNCTNSMEILFDGDKFTTTNMIGAFCARLVQQAKIEGRTTTIKNFTNTGNINVTPKTSIHGYDCYSGALPYASVDNMKHDIVADNIVNKGNIRVVSPLISNCLVIGGLAAYIQNENPYTITNSTNYGSIYIETESITHNALIGGLFGGTKNAGSNISLTNCHNAESADITFKANCVEDYNQMIGGLVGLPRAGLALDNCSNKGDVTILGSYTFPTNTFYVSAGGITGRYSGGALNLSNVSNSGKVIFGKEGKPLSINTGLLAGGIMGSCVGSASCTYSYTAPIVNTGDIDLLNVKLGEDADLTFVGGVMGKINAPLSNATALCNITAVGVKNMGMILGMPYDEATKVSNCKVGGSMCFAVGEYGPEDDPQWGPIPTALTTGNYYKYIYGTRDLDSSIAEADGCSYISKIE